MLLLVFKLTNTIKICRVTSEHELHAQITQDSLFHDQNHLHQD